MEKDDLAWVVPSGFSSADLCRSNLGRCIHTMRSKVISNRSTVQAHQPRFAVRMTQSTINEENSASSWNGHVIDPEQLIRNVKFNDAGLVPAIAQQWDTGEVLMMAWMSAESIRVTMKGGRAVYFSRSRKELWRKGDTSGQVQLLHDVILDCDGDTILLKVDQLGAACHTGRRTCFYTAYRPPTGDGEIIENVLIDPKELYKADGK